MTASGWLRDRADSYSRDAEILAHDGDEDGAIVYRTIRDELRKLADQLEAEAA